MASIGQGPVKNDQSSGISRASFKQVEYDAVDRGYSQQNSYSRTEGPETVTSQVPKPTLDEPAAEAESEQAANEILQDFAENAETPLAEQLKKAVQELKKKTLSETPETQEKQGSQEKSEGKTAKGTGSRGKRDDLKSQGYSQSQADRETSLSNPDDPDNVLEPRHAASTAGKPQTTSTSASFFPDSHYDDLTPYEAMEKRFYDVYLHRLAVQEIPDELRAEIDADLEAVTKAIFDIEQPMDIDSVTTQLITIQSKLQNERVKFDQEMIRVGQLRKEELSEKIISKIREGIAKVKKAAKSGLIGKIFGYIGLGLMAIATVIAGAAAFITTGPAGAALVISLMVAAMVIMVGMVVSSETNNFMMKIFGDSQEGKIGAMVFWTALMIALSLGAMLASGGTAAVGTAAKVAALLTKLTKVTQAVGGAAKVAEGSSQIATSAYTYEADALRADAMEDKAMMARLQHMLEDALESLQTALDELQAGYASAANIIKANHETKTTLARNLRA